MRNVFAGIIGLIVVCGMASFKDQPRVSSMSPQPIDMRDLMDFLGIHGWKVRMASEVPFNIAEVTLAWYQRPSANANFTRHALGEAHSFQSLQKLREQVVTVLWRNEALTTRFHVNFPGRGSTDYTAPAERFADYLPTGDAGMEIDRQHIIAVSWIKDDHGVMNMSPDKRNMNGYIAVEFQLHELRGIGD